jgi:adenosine deaminase
MCLSKLHGFLKALPKVELHLHIEGTLAPAHLFELAGRNEIVLPTSDPAFASPEALLARYQRFTSLSDFLHYYYIGMSVLLTEADFEMLTYEYFKTVNTDNCVHAEIFFDPQAHTTRGIPFATVVQGIVKAQRRAEADFGITSKLVMCFLRDMTVASANEHFAEAEALGHFSDGTLAGIGLDSAEVGFPPELFRDVYTKAKEAGVHRTAHAGEEGDTTYIAGALKYLDVERIDHGIRLVEDEALTKRISDEGKLLTICPISNVKLQTIKSVAELPIRKFLDKGVQMCFNSDDPAYFGGYILDNYCAVEEAFGLTMEEWKGIAHAAVKGSWADAKRKWEIYTQIDDCVFLFS